MGMGNHLNGNGNYLHSHGNLFPQTWVIELAVVFFCALHIVYNTKGTMCLNFKYEAEPDTERL